MISPGIDEQDYETDYPNYLRGFLSLLIQGFLILFVYVLAPLSAEAQYTGAGLAYPTGIEPGNPSDCENPGHCWYVDCDAVSDGVGTYASPFWGFETLFGYYSAGSFITGSIAAGDYVYVKGTCNITKSANNDTATGPYQMIRSARQGQLGTLANPTVIKSYLGTAQAVFDGEFATALTGVHDASNDVSGGMIKIAPTIAGSALGIKIQNIKVTQSRYIGINCGYGAATVAYCDINSVWFEDNDIDSTGTTGPLFIDCSATDFAQAHTVRNCKFTNNYRNCAAKGGNMTGDTSCARGDPSGTTNDGALGIYSANGATPIGTVTIQDSYFDNNFKHIKTKHNGSASTTVKRNYFGSAPEELIYIRQTTWSVFDNIFDGGDNVFVVTTEAPPGGKTRSLDFHGNTVYKGTRLIALEDSGTYADYLTWNVYNNAIDSQVTTSPIIAISTSGTVSTFTPAKWTSHHNYFYVNASAQTTFSSLMPAVSGSAATVRSFANTMTYLSDASSSVSDPKFTNPASDNFCLQAGSARTASNTGSYIGALDPAGAICTATSSAAPQCLMLLRVGK